MTFSLTRRMALGLLAGAALFSQAALAQPYPNRVIKMVVPYPAGGPTDVIARIVAEEMGKELGQNVIVENMAGASGAVGTRAVARATPDGYTLVFGNNQTHGNNMFLLKDPGYDAVKDFAPLAGAGAFEHVFVVKNDLPVKTISELVELAKKDPGKLNYGSTGVGSGSHLATELFMTRTGIKMTHVPFRGAAPLVTELMGGRIDVSNSTLPSVLAQFQAGQMRAIGLASPQRNPLAPDVPTLREQGVANADAESWAAFFAPVNTPKPVLDKLSGTIIAILNKPDVKERITKLGFTLNVRDPETFKPYLDKEIQTWAEIIKAANIGAE
ncbi:tripartite tricarboxylate transporter substrate binding protein [Microvirga sp. ACRRW]|uniref:Bug family tripartite tricarboxylate transporter substrate binding protein n=1 Tax=Microvirga sp. ACRRW TaxID=2918205 RepID=UPI001EF5993D|nr:tripartite tricarboxylate transporter substrate binding protein [Microvirga sp. ACRRW]MCG7391831.1 tripartite tricarboxylate transporter substrate binding protein [Microvirga sp. ACRRW]